mmetsp:Transcript_16197/g.48999  ORF Transcript_16197/g.48999 Transcript_16197/m.48999 type:complete len:275 (-) Transcript_16197:322-1146(-)|eukprot:CAMPEP_0198644078 /NCGR_PEP_ID=MMETSP1467-20131203/374_1 /TAXON_ID=1462469 /ORGANISM="unid. sp., Strain CCMP2135" /LENGTH=274 /DNA_ID=CAMNT_0044379523 /DNA_START=158 /DNA_END=982 /DNA_ORIENTATION=+
MVQTGTVGDVANGVVLANSGLFAAVFVAHAVGKANLFSESFQREGFCVKNSGDAYWSSHALSFYADCVGAAVILCLLLVTKLPKSAAKPLWVNVPGILAHGAAHMALSFAAASGEKTANAASGSPKDLLVLVAFWVGLLKAADPDQGYVRLVLHSLLQTAIVVVIPAQYGFTYVQTVLLVANSVAALCRSDKDVFYDLFGVLVSVPIGFVAWFESFACDKGFKDLGGHLFYDATIPVSILFYYALAVAVSTDYDPLNKTTTVPAEDALGAKKLR